MTLPVDTMRVVLNSLTNDMVVAECPPGSTDSERAARDAAAAALETARHVAHDFVNMTSDSTVRALISSQDADTLYRCLASDLRNDHLASVAYKAACRLLEERDASETSPSDDAAAAPPSDEASV